jgi:hypothetical protein
MRLFRVRLPSMRVLLLAHRGAVDARDQAIARGSIGECMQEPDAPYTLKNAAPAPRAATQQRRR